MAQEFTICAATVGYGIWFSADGGGRWRKSKMELPYFAESGDIPVRALCVTSRNPHQIFAGSEYGLHRSEDNGATWHPVESPMSGMQIWSIAIAEDNPEVIMVGTKPPAIYRSVDGGKRWEKLPANFPERCPIGPPRITNLVFDPNDSRTVWAGVELGGVYRSSDGGDSWTQLPQLGPKMSSTDVHGLAVSKSNPGKVLVTTPDGIWSSRDQGESWSLHSFPKFAAGDHVSYCRGVAVKLDDPNTIFVANGNDVPGDRGGIQRSKDGGQTWELMPLPVDPNSTIYWFAMNPADPNLIVANSMFGYIYVSRDGGDTWSKTPREFSEIRTIAWMPN